MVFILACITACDRHREPPPDRPLNVTALEFPLADIAREIGGERVQVDWLIDLGDPINTYALNTAERERLRLSDLVLCDGVRTEPWAASEMGRLRDTGAVISAETLDLAKSAPISGVLTWTPWSRGRRR